jgi:hypothetical protein
MRRSGAKDSTTEPRVSPYRTFYDDASRLWNAWDVIPHWGERRRAERRAGSQEQPGERRLADRRRHQGELRISLPPRLAKGWLAFESGDERRRLAPIPNQWDALSDDGLRELWRTAESLPPRRKRFVE